LDRGARAACERRPRRRKLFAARGAKKPSAAQLLINPKRACAFHGAVTSEDNSGYAKRRVDNPAQAFSSPQYEEEEVKKEILEFV
jgi:hypothetical protein